MCITPYLCTLLYHQGPGCRRDDGAQVQNRDMVCTINNCLLLEVKLIRVPCSGGGIAGLALAIALNQYTPPESPLQVDIYEGDPELRTVGAGITVWPRTWGVMRHLGVRDDLSRVTVQTSSQTPGSQADDLCGLRVRRGPSTS